MQVLTQVLMPFPSLLSVCDDMQVLTQVLVLLHQTHPPYSVVCLESDDMQVLRNTPHSLSCDMQVLSQVLVLLRMPLSPLLSVDMQALTQVLIFAK